MRVKVLSTESLPNCVRLHVETEVNGKTEDEWFNVSHEQYSSGNWKKHVKLWADKLEARNALPTEVNPETEFEV